MIMTTATTSTLKNLAYIPAFLLGLSFEAWGILAVFMIVDTILGIIRSMTLYGAHSFTSRLLAHGVVSKCLVLFVPIILVWTGRGVGFDFLPVAKGTLSVLVLAEAYSILGHVQSIRTKKDIKEFDAVSMVLKGVRETLEKMLISDQRGKDKHN